MSVDWAQMGIYTDNRHIYESKLAALEFLHET